MTNNRKIFLWGALFGIASPLLGLFAGLQVAPFLGTVLMFPFVIIAKLTGLAIENFPIGLMISSIASSFVQWGLVFVGIKQIL